MTPNKTLTVKQLEKRRLKLKSERSAWLDHWQECTDFFLTNRNTIQTKQLQGQKRTFQLLDNTGTHSLQLLAGAMQSLLTNPDLPWFEMTTGNLELDSIDSVRLWMQKTTRSMHNVLNNSNFQTEVHEFYLDVGGLGTGAVFMEEDVKKIVNFSTKFIADYGIDEGPDGYVNALYREWMDTPANLIAEFGKKAMPKKIMDVFNKGLDDKFLVIHWVYPKYWCEAGSKDKMQYVSHYYLPDLEHDIESGEFADFPFLVTRWSKAAGEKYGRSPGMVALPELKVLNKMNETLLIGAQKMVDPPLQMEDDGVVGPLITKPGGINYTRPGAEPIRPIFNDMRLDFGFQAMEDRRQRVRDAFYVDQLKLRQSGPMMTATEVLQRTEESMRLLGPLLGRMQAEFLRPLIDRLFKIMWDRKMIEAPPSELQGRAVDVKYSSLIAKSQRINEGQGVSRVIAELANLTAAQGGQNMQVWQNINQDAVARLIVGTFGAPQEMLYDQKIVDQQREAQAAQQKQMMEMQQKQMDLQNAESMANTVKAAQG